MGRTSVKKVAMGIGKRMYLREIEQVKTMGLSKCGE